jgi:hypothetical protein
MPGAVEENVIAFSQVKSLEPHPETVCEEKGEGETMKSSHVTEPADKTSPALRANEAVISTGAEGVPTGDVMDKDMGDTVKVSAMDWDTPIVVVMAATVKTHSDGT